MSEWERIKIGSEIEPGYNALGEPVGQTEMDEIDAALAFAGDVGTQLELLKTMAQVRDEMGMDPLPDGITLADGSIYEEGDDWSL